MRLLHIHLRREALLLLRIARLLLESLLWLAAERASAPELLLLRIALLLREAARLLLRIALLLRKPLLLLRISLLRITRLLLYKLLLLLGITLLEALLLRLLTKPHGRLLRRRGPIQGRRRRRSARVVVRNELLQPLCVRLSFRSGRVELDGIIGRVARVPVDLQHGRLLGWQRRALGRLVEDAVVRLERGGLAVAVRGDAAARELGEGVRGRLYRCGRWLY